MGFHPDRLTGRRARRWRQSLDWLPAPANVPSTLTQLLTHPDRLRAWARVKVDSGKFHYVALVRNRFVFPSHHLSRAKARQLGDAMAILGGEGYVPCRACEQCLKRWGDISDADNVKALPATISQHLASRRPSATREVIDLKLVKKNSYSDRKRISQVSRDDPVGHPRPWVEPGNPALRWRTPRRMNGGKPRSLSGLIRGLVRVVFDRELPGIPIVTLNRYESNGWGDTSASRTTVEVRRTATDPVPRLHLEWNMFNWYVRAYIRDREVVDDWLVLVPGASEYPDAPVICDAVSPSDIKSAYAEAAKIRVKPGSYVREVTVPVVHGVLCLLASGWAFAPTVPRTDNRVRAADQLVPEARWDQHSHRPVPPTT